MKKPITSQEAWEYDRKVAHSLFQTLKTKIPVTINGITEDELFDPNRKPNNKNSKGEILTGVNIKNTKILAEKGTIPTAIITLPPVFFPENSDAKSTVPYLNVRVVSWTAKNTKTIQHTLLSHLRRENPL